ncbi:GRAM domain-containing protein 2A-like isoform X2 [Rissa tridactyla]|uniref:GRAM domain-containing protein 2A-like isoform X2 n=1 Tax=Rissa tridactyla TaxID=75485 RepID=UPI0023BAA948|nr:GRAM domain-containing protein 2A-like isoform X2 [Rissa tridactyla]
MPCRPFAAPPGALGSVAQTRAGVCPDASLQTCCGQCPPRLRALPHGGRRRRRRPRDGDGSGRSVSGSGTGVGGRGAVQADGTGGLGWAHHQRRDTSVMAGKLRRRGRGVLEEKRWQSLEERGTGGTQMGHPVLTRSKTCDPSFCKGTEQAAAAAGQGHASPSVSLGAPGRRRGDPSPVALVGRSPWGGCQGEGPSVAELSKRAAGYRKAFGELAEREALLACFSCAWQRDVPYHGRLYISSRHVCFHSSLLLRDIKAVVPVSSISALKKTNTALLVPNALSIRTAEGEKFLFVSLHRREATFQLLKSVCKHLQDNGWRPLDSPSTEEILRKPLTSSRSDLEQSTPEPDSLQELPDGPSPTPRQAEEEDEEAAAALSNDERVPLAKPCSLRGGPHTALWDQTTAQLRPLNTVILIYLLLMVALLLSSGYIGLRIVELEQQLASAGARPGLNLSHQ